MFSLKSRYVFFLFQSFLLRIAVSLPYSNGSYQRFTAHVLDAGFSAWRLEGRAESGKTKLFFFFINSCLLEHFRWVNKKSFVDSLFFFLKKNKELNDPIY